MHDSQTIRAHMSQLRIICSAILGGVTLFAGVVWYLNRSGSLPSQDLDLPDWMGLLLNGVALALLLGAHFSPVLFSSHGLSRDEEGALARHRQIVIVGFALREAAAFIALVGALLTGQLLGAGAMVALAYVSMIMAWPSRDQIPT